MKISKYILFQIFGWGSFALFNIYIAYITQELTEKVFGINIVLSLLGFILSNEYKKYIQKHSWVIFETEKLIKNVLTAIIILSVLYNICYYIILLIVQKNVFTTFGMDTYFGSFLSVFFIFSFWNLLYFAWQYIEKNKRIQIETLKMESSLKDLEIKTIRSYLQPHFIFNSLNSIRALIDENPQLAREAITKISNILRNTITKQETTDSLQNELKLVEDYLDLEKIRFEERLHFEKEIDINSLQIQIPTMMLQTLIENAIKHGISKLEYGGNIFLKTEIKKNNMLHIIIKNDIDNHNKKTKSENNLGFGISSTLQRLKLLYENDAKFSLTFNKKIATVEIDIPIKQIYF